MSLKNSIKYGLMKKPLALAKTYDSCPSRKPKLTVVMLHGIASSSDAFKNTIKYLSGTPSLRDVRFVTFDLLGAGKSYASNELIYDLKEQLEALHNSILKLELKTPLVLIGHSMGSIIALNFADTFKKSVKKLILASPPLYTEKDLNNPAFKEGVKLFEKFVGARHKGSTDGKQFKNSMDFVVLTDKNYKVLSKITTDSLILYGDQDQFVSSYNINKIAKENPKRISVIKTIGAHQMSRDKYHKLVPILEEVLNA